MSQALFDRSPDLKKLRDEGYDLEIRHGYLLLKDVPYVTVHKEVRRGVIVSKLNAAGPDSVGPPDDHTAMFDGDQPCDKDGKPLTKIVIDSTRRQLGDSLVVRHRFSSKPVGTGVYPTYYEKMTAYVAMLTSHAQALDPTVTAMTGVVVPPVEDDSPFAYMDTASSRAEINMVTKRLKLSRVALVGVGGTGSHVLDLVAKTPVREIHLFDGDVFFSHNAFRSPGAASADELRAKPKKTAYFKEIYSKLHKGIIEHPYYVDASNVHELHGMDFVFLCMDGGDAKRIVVEKLESLDLPFVDVGMGVELVDDSLRGTVRVTSSTPARRTHFRSRVSLAPGGPEDEYDSNIQIADLNALNAALAVIRWKKYFGFYLDFEREHHSAYVVNSHALISDDQA